MITLGLPLGGLHVLCLGAHPDDIEIGCGGTLLTLAEARDVSATVVVATGSGTRREEAVKATPRFLPGAGVAVTVGVAEEEPAAFLGVLL
jgi:LmbE family N-acetylglucosaminyl deacetylase